jgi:hypothetical protein
MAFEIPRTKNLRRITAEELFEVHCFGQESAVITALEGVLGSKPAIRKCAAWRSMWLRTSTKPQDMVFSVMHLLGVRIEVNYGRSREDLIVELAQKTSSFPSWLDIGASLPFDSRLGLLPALPPFDPNARPTFKIGGRSVLVGDFIREMNYVKTFDIKIKTPADKSHNGDHVCAQIFEIQYPSPRTSRKPYISGNGKIHEFDSSDKLQGSHVMVIGEKEVSGYAHHSYYAFIGPSVCFIRKSERGVWERVNRTTDIPRGLVGVARSHLRIGGSPGAEISACDCHRSTSVTARLGRGLNVGLVVGDAIRSMVK